MFELIELATERRCQMVEITGRVAEIVARHGLEAGAVVLQSLHTTAGLTINENADPDVQRDMVAKLDRLVPEEEAFYRHTEGNSDSHLKTALVGPSLMVVVEMGKLVLGRWQGIFFCEWDGPRSRRVAVRLLRA